jgi:hypothetical protein
MSEQRLIQHLLNDIEILEWQLARSQEVNAQLADQNASLRRAQERPAEAGPGPAA